MLFKQNFPKSDIFHVLADASVSGGNIRSTSQMIRIKIKNIILRQAYACKTLGSLYSSWFNWWAKLNRRPWNATWFVENRISWPSFWRFLVFFYWFCYVSWIWIACVFWGGVDALLCWRSEG